jgi:hypothetical protein
MPQRSRRFGASSSDDRVLVSQGGYAVWEARVQTETIAATASGAAIATGTHFVTVTSADANNIIILPTPTPGTVVRLRNGATGYELRSSSPTTVAINGGVAAAAESAIAANTLVEMVCDTATTWIGCQWTTAGVQSAVQVAAT